MELREERAHLAAKLLAWRMSFRFAALKPVRDLAWKQSDEMAREGRGAEVRVYLRGVGNSGGGNEGSTAAAAAHAKHRMRSG